MATNESEIRELLLAIENQTRQLSCQLENSVVSLQAGKVSHDDMKAISDQNVQPQCIERLCERIKHNLTDVAAKYRIYCDIKPDRRENATRRAGQDSGIGSEIYQDAPIGISIEETSQGFEETTNSEERSPVEHSDNEVTKM